jgi:hypothetical protein
MIYEGEQKLILVIKLTLLKLLSYYNDRLVIYILNYLYIKFLNKSIYYIQKEYKIWGGRIPPSLPSHKYVLHIELSKKLNDFF